MKIKVIKPHHHYAIGEHDVPDGIGNYLISTGIAVNDEAKEKVVVKPKLKEPTKIK